MNLLLRAFLSASIIFTLLTYNIQQFIFVGPTYDERANQIMKLYHLHCSKLRE